MSIALAAFTITFVFVLSLWMGYQIAILRNRSLPPKLDITFDPLHDGVQTPVQATEGSAGYDAFADIAGRDIEVWRQGGTRTQEHVDSELVLYPSERATIPLGFKMHFSHGAACFLMPKSGRACKEGLSLSNAVGLGDADYPEEYKALVVNIGTTPLTIKHNEKVVQLTFVPVYEANFHRGTVHQTTSRSGGLGHTGL